MQRILVVLPRVRVRMTLLLTRPRVSIWLLLVLVIIFMLLGMRRLLLLILRMIVSLMRQVGPLFVSVLAMPVTYLLAVWLLMALRTVTPLLWTMQEPQSMLAGIGHRSLNKLTAALLMFMFRTVSSTPPMSTSIPFSRHSAHGSLRSVTTLGNASSTV